MTKGTVEDGVVYHAGFPNAGEDQRLGGLSLDRLVVQHRASTYFWRLETLVPELHWPAGSIISVDRALVPKQGSVIVVVEDDAFLLARQQRGRFVRLDGTSMDGEVTLWGVVTYCVQKVG
jgi:hypothetical protein